MSIMWNHSECFNPENVKTEFESGRPSFDDMMQNPQNRREYEDYLDWLENQERDEEPEAEDVIKLAGF